jgi:hypothetical protein
MILASLLLFLAGVALLTVGLVQASILMEVLSIAAALLSGLALYFGVRQRRPAFTEPDPVEEPAWRSTRPVEPVEPVERAVSEPAGVPVAHEPEEEQVSADDAQLVAERTDNVLVVDGRPRYHRAGCRSLAGAEIVLVPVGEARAAGFTPCGWCRPDSHLLGGSRPAVADG